MASKCKHCGGRCRKHRPNCNGSRKEFQETCHCDGVCWDSKVPAGHRKGSACGKFGVCEHHPRYAEIKYAELERPVRNRR